MGLKPKLDQTRGRSVAARMRGRVRGALGLGRRAALLVEFAIVGPIFFLLLFFAFDTAYGLYLQGMLDTAVQATARDIQVGAQQPTSAAALQTLVCDNALGFLNCNNVFVRVERIDTTACPGGNAQQDLYNATDGSLPQTGGVIQLGLYGGSGTLTGPTICETSSSSTGFCIAGPSPEGEPEVIVLSAVYIAPSFLLGLSPYPLSYGGSIVKADFSSSAFITEAFTQSLPTGTTTTC